MCWHRLQRISVSNLGAPSSLSSIMAVVAQGGGRGLAYEREHPHGKEHRINERVQHVEIALITSTCLLQSKMLYLSMGNRRKDHRLGSPQAKEATPLRRGLSEVVGISLREAEEGTLLSCSTSSGSRVVERQRVR